MAANSPVATGGGGDGGKARLGGDVAGAPAPSSKTRMALLADPEFEFTPMSLIGSWFHRLENDEMIWQGAVVAEPARETYLLEVAQLAPGAKNVQRLMGLEQMLNDEEGYDWRFYDSKESADAAYVAWVSTERQRA